MHGTELLSDMAVATVAATLFALVARLARQPLLLGYLVAGAVVGPEIGLGLVHDAGSIHLISELGLVLLLFIIGLEMDLQKLAGAGRPLLLAGILQFPLCLALGLVFARPAGLPLGGGRFDAGYVAVGLALSSTMIVIKLLYDKYELNTMPGRITLAVLVFQDVWAILALALQPTLLTPSLLTVALAVGKGAGLVVACLGLSRYVLPRVFAFAARAPELVLAVALSWCFLVSGVASALGLSREMGALVAGVGLSTFPYNVDVVAKVTNIRDFFVTLFFVALGMQIPAPRADVIGTAALAALFLLASRFLTVLPVLAASGVGLRNSLVPAINLSQMSEFSLVIASLGLAHGHLQPRTMGILTFVFVFTAVGSTYLISFSHELQTAASRLLRRFRFAEPRRGDEEGTAGPAPSIVLLGFYRDASSLLHQLEQEAEGTGPHPLLRDVLVIDFNPQVLAELTRRGVRSLYGDVAHMDTLHHAAIGEAKVVLCTLTDSVLKGTTNARLLQQVKRVCPEAQVVVAADTIEEARRLYDLGAHFVFVPRIHSAHLMAEVLKTAVEEGLALVGEEERAGLHRRREVLA